MSRGGKITEKPLKSKEKQAVIGTGKADKGEKMKKAAVQQRHGGGTRLQPSALTLTESIF